MTNTARKIISIIVLAAAITGCGGPDDGADEASGEALRPRQPDLIQPIEFVCNDAGSCLCRGEPDCRDMVVSACAMGSLECQGGGPTLTCVCEER